MPAFWNPTSPFDLMLMVFNELYPDHNAEVEFSSEETNGRWVGKTLFPDDGGNPIVVISINCTVEGAMEVLAHELAHVVLGVRDEDDHDAEWEKVFEEIYEAWAMRMEEVYENFEMESGGKIQ